MGANEVSAVMQCVPAIRIFFAFVCSKSTLALLSSLSSTENVKAHFATCVTFRMTDSGQNVGHSEIAMN